MIDGIRPHVLVVQHPNSRMRTFHVVVELTNTERWNFGSSLFGNFDKNKKPGELAKTLGKQMLGIPGVTSGSISQYEIQITISDAFEWEDIGPLVFGQLIKTIYPETVGQELLVSTRVGWVFYVMPSAFGFGGESDDGHRTRYQDMTKREPIRADIGSGRPCLDIEHMLDVDKARAKNTSELVRE